MQHSLAFFLVAFNVSLTSVGMPEDLAVLFNLFLIAPLLSMFNKLFQQLLVCSCLRDGPLKERMAGVVEWIDASGYEAPLPETTSGIRKSGDDGRGWNQ